MIVIRLFLLQGRRWRHVVVATFCHVSCCTGWWLWQLGSWTSITRILSDFCGVKKSKRNNEADWCLAKDVLGHSLLVGVGRIMEMLWVCCCHFWAATYFIWVKLCQVRNFFWEIQQKNFFASGLQFFSYFGFFGENCKFVTLHPLRMEKSIINMHNTNKMIHEVACTSKNLI